MYGFINHIVQVLVLRKFGEPTWEEIKKVAGVEIDGMYPMLERYDDASTYNLVYAAEKVLKVPASKILELFGEMFYQFTVESGYSVILQALAPTPIGFLESLDTLHDHLGSVYVGMRAPSFRCTKEDGEDGEKRRFFLHYYSHREGLSPVVIGVVRAACWDIFKAKAELTVAEDRPLEEGEVCFEVQISAGEGETQVDIMGSTDSMQRMPTVPRLSPETFAGMFPFHILFNRKLQVIQVGTVIARLLPNICSPDSPTLDKIFEIQRPKLEFAFPAILGHINTVYVLGEIKPPKGRKGLRLKGQMAFQFQDDLIMYFSSPSVTGMQQMYNQGLTLSDIPVHDSTKNLVVLSDHFSAEYELSHELELMTNYLQLRYRDVEIEKQKTENLVFAAFPPSIVEDVKKGRKVPARQYTEVTIMFTGINGFAAFCVTHEPLEIVNLLNSCYTEMDSVLDPEGNGKVYKVETIADHYMCVSGCPVELPDHARAITELGIRLMGASKRVFYTDGKPLEITVGIHSGEIVAGVIGMAMPRFCLFGDTVNTTSRTESFGKKGFINMTQYTYDYLQRADLGNSDFNFTFFDNVAMKGKPAPVTVWLVDSKKNPVCPQVVAGEPTLAKTNGVGPTPVDSSAPAPAVVQPPTGKVTQTEKAAPVAAPPPTPPATAATVHAKKTSVSKSPTVTKTSKQRKVSGYTGSKFSQSGSCAPLNSRICTIM